MRTRTFVRHSILLLFALPLLFACNAPPPPAPTVAAVASTAVALTPTPVPATDTPVPPTATDTSVPLTATRTMTATPIPPTITVVATATMPIPTKPAHTATRPAPTATRATAVSMADNFLDTFDTPGILKGVHNDICTSSYEGGQFHISVVKQNYFCWSVYPREYNNLSLEVDTTMYTGEGSCGAGASLIFGFKDNKNFYMLDVTRLCPAYHVTKMTNGQWQTIRPWDNGLRLGPAPGPDMAFTHLKLVVQGSDFQLYSQDQLMDKISDSAYSGGRIALSAGTWGQNVHVSFDNLQINALP